MIILLQNNKNAKILLEDVNTVQDRFVKSISFKQAIANVLRGRIMKKRRQRFFPLNRHHFYFYQEQTEY